MPYWNCLWFSVDKTFFIQNYAVIHHLKPDFSGGHWCSQDVLSSFHLFFILSRSSLLISLFCLLLPRVWNFILLFFFFHLTKSFSSTTLHQSSAITMPIVFLSSLNRIFFWQNLFFMLSLLNTPLVKSCSNSFFKKNLNQFAIWSILYCTGLTNVI